MRLYYLTSLEIANLILAERRMKLSLFDELNDPFELLGASIGDKLARRVFKSILRKHWTGSIGIICFSDTWRNPVMWAHYGDKHRGVCLGFDVPDELAKQVRYEPDRLIAALDHHKPAAGLTVENLETVLLTKYQDWAYEHEWRVFADLKQRDVNGRFYVDFGAALALRSVIVGSRCDSSVPKIAKLVSNADGPVSIWQARPGFTKFEIVKQERVRTIQLRQLHNRPRE
jgi:hypothetical protein